MNTPASWSERQMSERPPQHKMPERRIRIQRVLRNNGKNAASALSGGAGPVGPRSYNDSYRGATGSPQLARNASVSQDEEVLYQCTECDMIVKSSDPYCPFCGSVFADSDEAETSLDGGGQGEVATEEVVRPRKFDLFALLETKSRYKELLYQEANKGFAGSARLLEDIERMISALSSMGTDMTPARRLVGSAWEACRDGNWNLVSTLARQTEDVLAPSIPNLVRSELSRARELLIRAKVSGADISDYIIKVKSATHALRTNNPDEALRLTKELLDCLREDSIPWA